MKDAGSVRFLPKRPFGAPNSLNQRQLGVLKDCIRQIKATDALTDTRRLANLSRGELATLWVSDVVATIIQADMPRNLATFASKLLSEAIDQIVNAEHFRQIEAQKVRDFYKDNDTFGLF